jgi:hypothetical protein
LHLTTTPSYAALLTLLTFCADHIAKAQVTASKRAEVPLTASLACSTVAVGLPHMLRYNYSCIQLHTVPFPDPNLYQHEQMALMDQKELVLNV